MTACKYSVNLGSTEHSVVSDVPAQCISSSKKQNANPENPSVSSSLNCREKKQNIYSWQETFKWFNSRRSVCALVTFHISSVDASSLAIMCMYKGTYFY